MLKDKVNHMLHCKVVVKVPVTINDAAVVRILLDFLRDHSSLSTHYRGDHSELFTLLRFGEYFFPKHFRGTLDE